MLMPYHSFFYLSLAAGLSFLILIFFDWRSYSTLLPIFLLWLVFFIWIYLKFKKTSKDKFVINQYMRLDEVEKIILDSSVNWFKVNSTENDTIIFHRPNSKWLGGIVILEIKSFSDKLEISCNSSLVGLFINQDKKYLESIIGLLTQKGTL